MPLLQDEAAAVITTKLMMPAAAGMPIFSVHPHSRCKWPFRRVRTFGCPMDDFDFAESFAEASGRGTYLHRECGWTSITPVPTDLSRGTPRPPSLDQRDGHTAPV